MEKLLSMTTDKIIFLDLIDFSGFSRSKYWIGYFEAKDLKFISLKDTTRPIYEFFQKHWEGFFLLSALSFYNSSDDEIRERFKDEHGMEELEHYLNIFHHAKNSGFLAPYSDVLKNFHQNEMNRSDDPLLPARALTLNFNSETFLDYCEMVIAFYFSPVLGGECLLINPELKIALYPHDDIGFGVISLTEDKSLGIEFLEYCKQFENFRVYIE